VHAVEPGNASRRASENLLGLTVVKAMRCFVASNLLMTGKRRHSSKRGRRALVFARRVALGVGGALAGAMAAVYLIKTGLTFVEPVGMFAAFAFVGGIAGFLGVDLDQPRWAAVRRGEATAVEARGRKADPVELLSVMGTLLAQSSAFMAAWLIVFEAPLKMSWAIVIGFWWLFGVSVQASAGILARLRAVDPEAV
jgi:hypothetical protein